VNPLSSVEVNALLKKSRNLDFFTGVDKQPQALIVAAALLISLIPITVAGGHRLEADGTGAVAIQPPATHWPAL